jgi:hypothetical protein
VLESSETSGIGGSRNSGGSTLRVGDDAKDRQYRAFLDFNTSGLPDNAVVTSLDLRLKHAGITGTNPFKTHGNLMVDINNNAFSGNASLQLADFQAGASASSAAVVPNNISNNYYYLSLDSAACGHINTTGVTQMRLRFEKDDNDDRSADFLKLYSGDSTAANRPLLLITYYIP